MSSYDGIAAENIEIDGLGVDESFSFCRALRQFVVQIVSSHSEEIIEYLRLI